MRNFNYLFLFGSPEDYSPGLMSVMADKQILKAYREDRVDLEDVGNLKTVVRCYPSQKWFIVYGGRGNDNTFTAMTGAIMGDVIGSVYKHFNVKSKLKQAELIDPYASFTDNTVLTCAVAEGLQIGLSQLPAQWMTHPNHEKILSDSVRKAMLRYRRKYPSWDNGSAVCVSYAGWVSHTVEEAEKLAEITAKVIHSSQSGIKGLQAVAGSIMLLRMNDNKDRIRQYVGQYFDMNFTLDDIRDECRADVFDERTVPYAIMAFLEGESFADVITSAMSLGGDSNAIATIAGSIAEVIYPIPQFVRGEVLSRVDETLLLAVANAVDFFWMRLP